MSLYSRIVGHPFVYNRIRPIIVGGIDVSGAYELLKMDAGSTVLDIGCGTGAALDYLMAKLDRGKFCRTESEYHALVDRTGLRSCQSVITKSHPKSNGVKYLVMTLERSTD